MVDLPQTARHLGAARPAALVVAALLFSSPSAAVSQQTVDVSADAQATVHAAYIDAAIAEAAQRFAIPERWIRAVMLVESANDPHAVSSAGAMGLMQIMPKTWDELRTRYGLGDDPFDPRDNLLAGAAYLREMYDHFGSPGFLAAYNAGPGRYEEYLRAERPLPAETRAYVERLVPLIDAPSTGVAQESGPANSNNWRGAPLFTAPDEQRLTDDPIDHLPQTEERPTGLFVRPQAENSP